MMSAQSKGQAIAENTFRQQKQLDVRNESHQVRTAAEAKFNQLKQQQAKKQ